MKIRKIYLFILFITILAVLFSCKSRLNPRYYYNNKSLSNGGNSGGGDLPDDIDPDEPSGDTNAGGNGGEETNEDGTITV